MKTTLINIALFTKKSLNTYIDGIIDIVGYSKDSLSKECNALPKDIDEVEPKKDFKDFTTNDGIDIKIEPKGYKNMVSESKPISYETVSNDGLYCIDLNKNMINNVEFPLDFISTYSLKTKGANVRENKFGYFVSKILRNPMPQLLVDIVFKHDYKIDYLGNLKYDPSYMKSPSTPKEILQDSNKMSKAFINPKYLGGNGKFLVVNFSNIIFKD